MRVGRVASITPAMMLSVETSTGEPLEDRIEFRTSVSFRRISSTTNPRGNSSTKSCNPGCASNLSTPGSARSILSEPLIGFWL